VMGFEEYLENADVNRERDEMYHGHADLNL
jgi:hypothetical protein